MYTFYSNSEQDTVALAQSIAECAVPGTVVTLEGDLGAGKTRFSQAVGKALGVKQVVNSPTFTIIKEYQGATMPFYHMDIYRISQEEADELGLDDYIYGEGVTLIEWPSKMPDLLPEERLAIEISAAGPTEREISLHPYGTPYTEWCERLKAEGVLT